MLVIYSYRVYLDTKNSLGDDIAIKKHSEIYVCSECKKAVSFNKLIKNDVDCFLEYFFFVRLTHTLY